MLVTVFINFSLFIKIGIAVIVVMIFYPLVGNAVSNEQQGYIIAKIRTELIFSYPSFVTGPCRGSGKIVWNKYFFLYFVFNC